MNIPYVGNRVFSSSFFVVGKFNFESVSYVRYLFGLNCESNVEWDFLQQQKWRREKKWREDHRRLEQWMMLMMVCVCGNVGMWTHRYCNLQFEIFHLQSTFVTWCFLSSICWAANDWWWYTVVLDMFIQKWQISRLVVDRCEFGFGKRCTSSATSLKLIQNTFKFGNHSQLTQANLNLMTRITTTSTQRMPT